MRHFATSKAGNWHFGRGIKVAVFVPVQQRTYLYCSAGLVFTHTLPEVSEARQELLREFGAYALISRALALLLGLLAGFTTFFAAAGPVAAQQTQPQRLVENVDIIGNRRLRKDDILYYIQTRPGDPYNEAQIQRDYQTLLSLNFFDKTATRVYRKRPRGGVNVIFEVKELPIIRDMTFDGLKSVQESDVLKAFASGASACRKKTFTTR